MLFRMVLSVVGAGNTRTPQTYCRLLRFFLVLVSPAPILDEAEDQQQGDAQGKHDRDHASPPRALRLA